jgi:hypothetical protein
MKSFNNLSKKINLEMLLIELILVVVWNHLKTIQNIDSKRLTTEVRLHNVPVKMKCLTMLLGSGVFILSVQRTSSSSKHHKKLKFNGSMNRIPDLFE